MQESTQIHFEIKTIYIADKNGIFKAIRKNTHMINSVVLLLLIENFSIQTLQAKEELPVAFMVLFKKQTNNTYTQYTQTNSKEYCTH